MRRLSAVGRACALALVALGCAPGPVDTEALARRHPALAGLGRHHLDETTPYLLPRDGTLVLFLCRWRTPTEIPVAISPDASAEERAALEAVLRAWERAGLGVRFREVPWGRERLTVGLADASVPTAKGVGVGSTVVDCRIEDAEAAGGVLPAAVSGAAIRLARRTPPDIRGRDRPLTPEEIAGIALHELGHALGFQGHVSWGDTAMMLSPDEVSERGRDVMEGAPVRDATLRALYSVPSGTVLRRLPVAPARTAEADALADAAARHGLRGPFVRVGDLDGRVFWRDRRSDEYGVVIRGARATLRDADRLAIEAEPAARALISGAALPVR